MRRRGWSLPPRSSWEASRSPYSPNPVAPRNAGRFRLLYLIAFFVHMVGVVNLFGGFILLNQAGVQYRRAATWEAARSFLTMLQFAPGMLIGGALILLASGAYMASTRWSMGAPWVTVGMLSSLLAFALAIFVLGPGLGR